VIASIQKLPRRIQALMMGAACVTFLMACQPQAAAPAGDEKSCEEYATKLCEVVGAETPTCMSVTSTTKLMAPAACAAGLANMDYSKGQLATMRKVCDDLVGKLCGDIGPDTSTCKMVSEKTKAFPVERCTQMMEKYPEVLAQLQQMEAANKPLDAEKRQSIETANAGAFGPADAKVTLVEFSDFECPFCSRAANVLTQVKEKYSDKVRVVFRHFPLSFHKNAHLASQASIAAGEQGKFWEFHDMMFANQKQLDRASLDGYAQKIGLKMGLFKKALDGGAYKGLVDGDMKLGETVAVSGTPTMFLNGERVQNPTDFAVVSKAIDEALAQAN